MSDTYDPNSADYRAFRANVVNDANQIFKDKWAFKKHDPIAKLLEKADKVTQKIRHEVTPILQAGGAKDRSALQSLIAIRYTEELNKQLTSEERLALLTIIHTEIALGNIEQDHWGLNKPDGIEPG